MRSSRPRSVSSGGGGVGAVAAGRWTGLTLDGLIWATSFATRKPASPATRRAMIAARARATARGRNVGAVALGSAVVRRLVAAGRQVVVPARRPGRVALPPGATEIECDLEDADAVSRLRSAVEAIGAWEGAVSASGGFAGGRAHELDDEAI